MITLEIEGRPIPLQRPRLGRNRVFDSQKEEKEQIRWQIKPYINRCPFKGPLEVKFYFFFKPPKRTSAVKRRQMLNGRIKRIERPDLSNLVKFYEDVGNYLLWDDDAQIIDLSASKLYGEREKTVIQILDLTN